jgi:hypothetical protein
MRQRLELKRAWASAGRGARGKQGTPLKGESIDWTSCGNDRRGNGLQKRLSASPCINVA